MPKGLQLYGLAQSISDSISMICDQALKCHLRQAVFGVRCSKFTCNIMKNRLVPTLAVAFYLAMAFFVTYPGYVPFDRIRPFVLGMPFAMFWQVLCIIASIFVLTGVYRWEKRRSAARRSETGGG
jgi:NADH:ubiquinone oxidoreductase subunit 2 (subunit N)